MAFMRGLLRAHAERKHFRGENHDTHTHTHTHHPTTDFVQKAKICFSLPLRNPELPGMKSFGVENPEMVTTTGVGKVQIRFFQPRLPEREIQTSKYNTTTELDNREKQRRARRPLGQQKRVQHAKPPL